MAAAPVFNPSPRTRFQADDRRLKAHLSLLERTDLQVSLDYALMEYQNILAGAGNGLNDAAANHFKMVGVLQFLDVFKNLARQQAVPERKIEGQLLHGV
jgi:hypothetical protein